MAALLIYAVKKLRHKLVAWLGTVYTFKYKACFCIWEMMKMLKRFSLKNYKNFKDELVLDLGSTAGYQFNTDCLYKSLISKMMIYGRNATGKSNLGTALTDICYTIMGFPRYDNESTFLNADSDEDRACFLYVFEFDQTEVVYEYARRSTRKLLQEKLVIDEKTVFDCDYETGQKCFDGLAYIHADTVNTAVYENSLNHEEETEERFEIVLPFLRWLISNTAFHSDSVLLRLRYYVARMQVINNRSILSTRRSMNGFSEYLEKTGRLGDFEEFLNAMGIDCSLELKKLPEDQYALYFKHNKLVPFFETASSGTLAASVLYRRLFPGSLNSNLWPSLIYMDEFDAFYHYEMAHNVIKFLKEKYPEMQVILTTHNTNLMSNRIMRPDCLFILSTRGTLTPLCSATERELREGHNLEKMYISGEFDKYE